MGKKCIIEIENDRNIIETFDGKCTLAVSARLGNTEVFIDTNIPVVPYTEPDLDAIKQEEYEKGYKTAKVQCDIQTEKDLREVGERHYQKGLSDAWEAARKIGSNSMCSLKEMGFDFSQCAVSDYNPSWFVVKNYSASEAIEKIRQYEQKKEEQIQVGDEVTFLPNNAKGIVTECHVPDVYSDNDKYAVWYGGTMGDVLKQHLTKTGRTFPEIAEVLAKMKESE